MNNKELKEMAISLIIISVTIYVVTHLKLQNMADSKAKIEAKELVDKFKKIIARADDDPFREKTYFIINEKAKRCALICVESEYKALREMLFSLRSSRVIESGKVYLSRLDKLIELEKEVKQEILKQ